MSYPMLLPFWIDSPSAPSADDCTIPTTYAWTLLVSGGEEAEPPSGPSSAGRSLEGEDIWFDLASPDGADRVVLPRGDWKMVSGEEALRQSLLRRLLTSPGEWATKPEFGVGARDFLYEANVRSRREELVARIRAQFARDYRVARVSAVAVRTDRDGELVIEISVESRLRPTTNEPVVIATRLRG